MSPESKLRSDSMEIFQAGLKAADPREAILDCLRLSGNILDIGDRKYNLSEIDRLLVVGAGKASAQMAKAVEEVLGERIAEGIIVTKRGYLSQLSRIKLVEAGHPLPDESGVKGAGEIIKLLSGAGERDLVLCLISGGGSALLVAPAPGISLEDKRKTTELLLRCGARIEEINAVRKHLSQVKGGRLVRIAWPARVVSLILSDVVGDPLESIASGPTYPDSSTFEDCIRILRGYEIYHELPASVKEHLQAGLRGEEEESPKPGDPLFQRVQNVIIGNNLKSLLAAEVRAEELGYNTLILSSSIQGETREVAKVHAAIAKEILNSGIPVKPPACIISGGETTVTVRGKGLGGRNQEFVLASAIEIDGLRGVVVLSGGTDGTDGPTDAAGAIADGATVKRAQQMGLNPWDYLADNDSYHFFQKLGDLLITGPTNTNVMDLRLILVG